MSSFLLDDEIRQQAAYVLLHGTGVVPVDDLATGTWEFADAYLRACPSQLGRIAHQLLAHYAAWTARGVRHNALNLDSCVVVSATGVLYVANWESFSVCLDINAPSTDAPAVIDVVVSLALATHDPGACPPSAQQWASALWLFTEEPSLRQRLKDLQTAPPRGALAIASHFTPAVISGKFEDGAFKYFDFTVPERRLATYLIVVARMHSLAAATLVCMLCRPAEASLPVAWVARLCRPDQLQVTDVVADFARGIEALVPQ